MAVAKAKNIGISAYKLGRVMELVRGKYVEDALDTLRYMTTPAASEVFKVVNAAAANAEHNDLQSRDELKIVSIKADKATSLRRYRPKARGRVGAFDRPTAHITVVVDEDRSS